MRIEVKDKNMEGEQKKFDVSGIKKWLSSEITVTLPGWALAGGGIVALALLLAALD